MSISEDPNIEIGEASEEDMDFVTLGEGEEAPQEEAAPVEEKITMTRAEYQQMLQGKANEPSVAQGLSQLAKQLEDRPQQQQMSNVPYVAPPSDEELERDLFVPGKTIETLKRIMGREIAPIQGNATVAQMQMNKKLMKLDPTTKELFGKYEAEIEKKVQALPPQFRFQSDIYERAYREVINERQEEIINDRAASIAEKAVQEALAKAGIGVGTRTIQKTPSLQQEGSPGGAVKPKAKQTVFITQTDVREMIERGLDPNDADQKKIYWERYKKGSK